VLHDAGRVELDVTGSGRNCARRRRGGSPASSP
jgi:hypothetical protein